MHEKSDFYRRNLPHWQPDGAEYFITIRLAGSLPKVVINEIKQLRKKLHEQSRNRENNSNPSKGININKPRKNDFDDIDRGKFIHQKIFSKYEQLLDRPESGPMWLSQQEIAQIVKDAIHYRNQSVYDLYAYCIMSNHVHLVFKIFDNVNSDKQNKTKQYPVTDIMQSLKWYTARQCNKLLKRSGNAFWFPESYDHVIRNEEERTNIIKYTLENPVKARLVNDWDDWPYSWCKFTPTF